MKMIQKTIVFLVLISISASSFAQLKDTISVMTYNLMYYREVTSFCTSTNNNTSTKENAMEDIIDYKVPFGFLGRLVHPILVKPKLQEIFEFRRKKLIELFGELKL